MHLLQGTNPHLLVGRHPSLSTAFWVVGSFYCFAVFFFFCKVGKQRANFDVRHTNAGDAQTVLLAGFPAGSSWVEDQPAEQGTNVGRELNWTAVAISCSHEPHVVYLPLAKLASNSQFGPVNAGESISFTKVNYVAFGVPTCQ